MRRSRPRSSSLNVRSTISSKAHQNRVMSGCDASFLFMVIASISGRSDPSHVRNAPHRQVIRVSEPPGFLLSSRRLKAARKECADSLGGAVYTMQFPSRRATRQPTVAHFVPHYLPRTETFIYQVLTHHRRYRPIVLAHRRVETAALFPLRHIYVEGELRASWQRRAWLSRVPGLWRLRPVGSFGQALRRHQAQVLHVHFGHTGADVLYLSRRFQIPQVTSFYGWDD